MRMSKQEKKCLVPERRFPEFRDKDGWAKYQLGQCLSRHPEYGINAPAVPYSDNLPRYLRRTDISEDGEIRQDQKVSVAKDVTDENYLDEGDVVLARTGASVGKFAVVPSPNKEGVINQALLKLTVKYGYNLNFIKYTLEHPLNQEKLLSQSAGGAIKNVVGVDQLKEIELPIPSLQEQQKVADCLSSIDELITAQIQKINGIVKLI
jgi:type I restriction enzyme, S subunit